MKKKTILISTFLLCIFNIFAEEYLVHNQTIYKDSLWKKVILNYNHKGQVTNSTKFKSNNKTDWENYTYSNYQYTDSAVSDINDYIWKDNSWEIEKVQSFKYSNKKLILYETLYGDIQEISSYEYNDSSTIHTYKYLQNNTLKNTIITLQKNKEDKILYIKTYALSPQNDTLFAQITNFEHNINKTISTTYEKIDFKYTPTEKTITRYNSDNNISCEIQYKYKNNDWVLFAQETYHYNLTNQISEIIYQLWKNNFWISDYKRTYSYNKNGQLTTSDVQILQYKEWESIYQINYVYNDKGQIDNTFITQSFWSDNNKEYCDFISIQGNLSFPFIMCNTALFEYTSISTSTQLSVLPINIYPNPSKSGIVFIDTDQIIHCVTIYDINGVLLYQNQYSGYIDLSHFSNGLYIIQITTEEGKFSFKQIINNY